jgi:hypothetical protein
MKKTKKNAKKSLAETSVVTTAEKANEDISVHWPELGNIGVVIGDVLVPEVEKNDLFEKGLSASSIKTGGIFVEVEEQQIWPIRYSADSVNVQEYIPEFGFRKRR